MLGDPGLDLIAALHVLEGRVHLLGKSADIKPSRDLTCPDPACRMHLHRSDLLGAHTESLAAGSPICEALPARTPSAQSAFCTLPASPSAKTVTPATIISIVTSSREMFLQAARCSELR